MIKHTLLDGEFVIKHTLLDGEFVIKQTLLDGEFVIKHTLLDGEFGLPVALLSSVACELAPLRIVILCVFLYLFFYFSFDTCIVCNDYVRQKNTFGHWTTLH